MSLMYHKKDGFLREVRINWCELQSREVDCYWNFYLHNLNEICSIFPVSKETKMLSFAGQALTINRCINILNSSNLNGLEDDWKYICDNRIYPLFCLFTIIISIKVMLFIHI
jgi:hypothetical protein